jgi:hypothetical protein
MTYNNLQPAFSGGEFSPHLQHRVDIQKYGVGLKTAKNFTIHPYGGASNRPGTKFVAETKYSNKRSRLVQFIFSNEQAYVLEFGDQYVRFFRDNGQVLSGFVPYEVSTPYLEADILDLHFAQSNDVLYIVHPDYAPRTLTRFGDTSWTLATLTLNNGPFRGINTNASHTLDAYNSAGNDRLFSNIALFNAGHVGALFKLIHQVPVKILKEVIKTGTGTNGNYIPCGGTFRFSCSAAAAWTGTLYIIQSFDNGSTWHDFRAFTSPADVSGVVDEFCILGFRWEGVTNANWDLVAESFEKIGIVKVSSYISSTEVGITIIDPPGNWFNSGSPAVSTPVTEWYEGAFSSYRGYPSLVWFYQDRLSFAASPVDLQTLWHSQTGIYNDFGTSDPLVDTDAISINLPARTQNKILNVVPLSKMLVNTGANEWIVGPGNSGVFTPTSIETNIQGYRGSYKTIPIIIGNRLVFIQSVGSVVRDYAYDFNVDSYVSTDMTLFSSHLFKGYSIEEIAYQQEPDSVIWAIRDDGVLLSCTYLKEQEVLAWTPHETDGDFESVCTIPETTYDQPWFIVKRGNKRFVEYLVDRNANITTEDQFFVDCGISYSGAPADIISGLTHLEGKTVAILGDGYVFPQQVVTGGQITLSIEVSKAHVGLPYVADFETLDIELQQNDGTLMVKKVKVPEVFVRVLNSRGGYFGSDSSNLYEFINRVTEALDNPIDLYTGILEETVDSNYQYGGRIFIRQSHPLPMTILTVIPSISIGG